MANGGKSPFPGWLDPETGQFTECLRLPSGGDTSYPGLVYHEGRL